MTGKFDLLKIAAGAGRARPAARVPASRARDPWALSAARGRISAGCGGGAGTWAYVVAGSSVRATIATKARHNLEQVGLYWRRRPRALLGGRGAAAALARVARANPDIPAARRGRRKPPRSHHHRVARAGCFLAGRRAALVRLSQRLAPLFGQILSAQGPTVWLPDRGQNAAHRAILAAFEAAGGRGGDGGWLRRRRDRGTARSQDTSAAEALACGYGRECAAAKAAICAPARQNLGMRCARRDAIDTAAPAGNATLHRRGPGERPGGGIRSLNHRGRMSPFAKFYDEGGRSSSDFSITHAARGTYRHCSGP